MSLLTEQVNEFPEFHPAHSAEPLIMSVLAARKAMLKLSETSNSFAACPVDEHAAYARTAEQTPPASDDTDSDFFLVQPGDSWQSIASNSGCMNDAAAWAAIARLNNLSIELETSGQNKVTLHAGMRLALPSNEEAKNSKRIPYGTAWSANELRGR